MMHPHTQVRFISDEMGCGVFATAFIPKGTIVYVKDELELEITPEAYAELEPVLQERVEKYSYIDERGVRIVSWDHAKYVNHCCQCNSISTGYGFEIAIRDIQPGEEVTDEYGLFNLQWGMQLYCSQPGCRGCVSAEDFPVWGESWDEKAKNSLASLRLVDQPLLPLVDRETRTALEAYLDGKGIYRSVFSLQRPLEPQLVPTRKRV
ncbi:MAG: SET domain-containing protein [Lewinella sp.]|nr:SET domain-containing protein [Lewinella sp.]